MSAKQVLIAEDSSVLQNLIKKVISYLPNYEVQTVKNGKQVLEITKSTKFDIILMDINILIVRTSILIECFNKNDIFTF